MPRLASYCEERRRAGGYGVWSMLPASAAAGAFDITNWGLGVAVKVKVKLSLCLTKHHAMKAYWGSGCIAPLIL
jgi:hypothetical protein